MLVPFFVFHLVVIAGVFITFSIVLLLFVINITILIINIIKRHKRTLRKRIISIVLPGFGVIISVLLSLPYLKLFYKVTQEQTRVQRGIIDFDKLKNKAGVDTVIAWDEDVSGNEMQKHFIYDNKKYIKFDIFGWRDFNFNISDVRGIETNNTIGIILSEEQQKVAFLTSLINVLFPIEASERVNYKYIYTIKNCGDQSLLMVKYNSSLYVELFCDEEYFLDKNNYYNDIYNYNLIISKSDSDTYMFREFYYIDLKENVSHPLSRNNFDILTMNEQKYNNQGNSILILNRLDPKWREYKYIDIYGISGDGVYKKLFKHYIIDNDDIYYTNYYDTVNINVVKLNDDEKTFLLSLLE
jgi:hypothetical protein